MEKVIWWERRRFLALLVAASAVPLLQPETPSVVDVPGHMGRFGVQLDLAKSESLQRNFEFHWTLVGNLGPWISLATQMRPRTVSAPGITENFFDISSKLHALVAMLRDRWPSWDSLGVAVPLDLLLAVYRKSKLAFAQRICPAQVMTMLTVLAVRVVPGYSFLNRRLAWLETL